jgi:hypothetical protein
MTPEPSRVRSFEAALRAYVPTATSRSGGPCGFPRLPLCHGLRLPVCMLVGEPTFVAGRGKFASARPFGPFTHLSLR